MSVAVVTDSTAYFPDGLAERNGVRQVPLHVLVDDRHWLDGVQFGSAALLAALARRASVTTSRPTPGEFEAVYTEAIRAGADTVVSVHLSRALSGTWESARLAAEHVGAGRVRVVDSRSTGMGLGFAALAAAAVAAEGGDLNAVCETAARVGARTRVFFSVDSLEYLRRGGRIGPATASVTRRLCSVTWRSSMSLCARPTKLVSRCGRLFGTLRDFTGFMAATPFHRMCRFVHTSDRGRHRCRPLAPVFGSLLVAVRPPGLARSYTVSSELLYRQAATLPKTSCSLRSALWKTWRSVVRVVPVVQPGLVLANGLTHSIAHHRAGFTTPTHHDTFRGTVGTLSTVAGDRRLSRPQTRLVLARRRERCASQPGWSPGFWP